MNARSKHLRNSANAIVPTSPQDTHWVVKQEAWYLVRRGIQTAMTTESSTPAEPLRLTPCWTKPRDRGDTTSANAQKAHSRLLECSITQIATTWELPELCHPPTGADHRSCKQKALLACIVADACIYEYSQAGSREPRQLTGTLHN